jgi:Zn-finger nucleic acid-binding protein
MIVRTSGSSPSNKPDESRPELEKEKDRKVSRHSDKDEETLLKLVRSHLHTCPICKTEADWAVLSGATDRIKCPKCEAVWVVSEGGMKLFQNPHEGFQIDEFMYKAFQPWSFWQRLALKEEQIEWRTKLWKYFEQGILFSVIFIGLSIVWAVLLVALMLIGSIIGLIIGFLILLFLIGFLNAFLTDAIWKIDTRADWKSLLSHGFFLFIALLFANIPAFLINLVIHNLPIAIALFIVYCFIDGFICKKVAESYEITDHETRKTTEEYKTSPKPPWIHNQ